MSVNLICPQSKSKLKRFGDIFISPEGQEYPIKNNIPRFVRENNYTISFGEQWNTFLKTQLDVYSGQTITEDRAARCLGPDLWNCLEEKLVLECGCGAGRFTEILLNQKADLYSIDLSSAIDANAKNFQNRDGHNLFQADILDLPFQEESFDLVFGLGVVQHTPDTSETIAAMYRQVKPGGFLVIDHYTHLLSWYLHPSPFIRFFLRYFSRVSPKGCISLIRVMVDIIFPIHWFLRRLHPRLNWLLNRISPVITYFDEHPELNREQHKEWALLDTHDSLTEWYKHRKTTGQITRILEELGVENIDCRYGGNGIEARGQKPQRRFFKRELIETESEEEPLISIGVPVFNGQKSLSQALDSLLAQDYLNLEIIISDNASTDATAEICKEYLEKDSRVKYSRSNKNFGAVWNFNKTFKLSSGKYFMWAAHDDIRERSFVRECVEKMEQCPEAVVCNSYSATQIMEGGPLAYSSHLDDFENIKGPVERYEATLRYSPVQTIYGLFRSSAIRKTQIFPKVLGGEMSFIRELSIHGDFIQIPRVLFSYVMRDKWNTVDQNYFTLFGKKKKPWWYLPFLVLFFSQWKRLAYFPIPLSAKFRLSGILIAHEAKQVALKILIKLAGRLCLDRWKEKLGCAIYWRWMHQANIEVISPGLYLEKIIKPRLGWWN